MFKIEASNNTIIGNLKNFEPAGEDLIIRLQLLNNEHIEILLPKVPPAIVETMNRTGLQKLKDSILDMNKGQISLTKPLESDGHSVSSGKRLSADARPRLQIGGGSMVG